MLADVFVLKTLSIQGRLAPFYHNRPQCGHRMGVRQGSRTSPWRWRRCARETRVNAVGSPGASGCQGRCRAGECVLDEGVVILACVASSACV